jgi:hypothetical protein
MWVERRFPDNMEFCPVRDRMNVDLSCFSTHILCLRHIDLMPCNIQPQVSQPYVLHFYHGFDKSVTGNYLAKVGGRSGEPARSVQVRDLQPWYETLNTKSLASFASLRETQICSQPSR